MVNLDAYNEVCLDRSEPWKKNPSKKRQHLAKLSDKTKGFHNSSIRIKLLALHVIQEFPSSNVQSIKTAL